MSDGVIASLEHISHAYPGAVMALDDVSLTIERASSVALVGQNGSGKTTLAKHLNGLLRPTRGRVVVAGLDTARHPVRTLAAQVGYVFQNPGHQLFARTVAEELAFGPRNLGATTDDVAERVAATSTSLALDDVLDVHPYRLSFPMRKLVSIGAVLTMRPKLLVLDEPTTGQDHRTARRIVEVIREARSSGTTVLCVSHDMPFVAETSDRVVVLDRGRVVGDGSPRDVLSNRTLLADARLSPPQITELSLALPGRAPSPGALSVAELVAEMRARS